MFISLKNLYPVEMGNTQFKFLECFYNNVIIMAYTALLTAYPLFLEILAQIDNDSITKCW